MGYFSEAKRLCAAYDVKPNKRKGQNFLIEGSVYDKIIKAAELDAEDTVLEVGPGLGFLTFELAKKVEKVVAVELDDKLAEALKKRMDQFGFNDIEVVNKNILSIEPAPDILSKKSDTYKIVANLPYNITSIFLRRFLSEVQRPESMVLMVQREVAQRILSDPPESILSVMARFYSEPQKVSTVSKKSFWPQPRVDSAVVKLDVKKDIPDVDEEKFFKLVKAGYSSRRKMLKNNLASNFDIDQKVAGDKLAAAGVPVTARAQEFDIENWLDLLKECERFLK